VYFDFESIGRGFESLRDHHCNQAFAGSADDFYVNLVTVAFQPLQISTNKQQKHKLFF